MRSDHDPKLPRPGENHPELFDRIADALSRVRYGAIQLTVHDGKVMQVDVTERHRLSG